MTSMNTTVETANVRALTEVEIGDVGGGGISFGAYLRNLAWQLQNAPANGQLIECSEDFDACSFWE